MKYQFFGKVIVGLIGLASAGFVGLIVGFLIGHLLDRTLLKTFYFGPAENIEHIRNSFFETTFLLLGYMSKVDGRISQSETDYADQIIAQMALSPGMGEKLSTFVEAFGLTKVTGANSYLMDLIEEHLGDVDFTSMEDVEFKHVGGPVILA